MEEPDSGYNRWHPDIPPLVRCEPGDEVVLETRDAFDGQMGPDAALETVAAPDLDLVHPLTGPVYVNGAEPGDLLDVEILDIEPAPYGYSGQAGSRAAGGSSQDSCRTVALVEGTRIEQSGTDAKPGASYAYDVEARRSRSAADMLRRGVGGVHWRG